MTAGTTWQMDLVPIWIVQECEDSAYDPSIVQTSTYTASGGGTAGTSTFDTTSPTHFGAYGSGKHWSLVTDNGELVEVASVSGSTVTLKNKIKIGITSVKAREIIVLNIDRIAKIYGTDITEEFDAQSNPEKEQMSPSEIGLTTLKWIDAALWSRSTMAGELFQGGITINGTTLTQGVDFDLTTVSTPTAAMDLILATINSDIPDVTAYHLKNDLIVLTGILRSVSVDLITQPIQDGIEKDVLKSQTNGFPAIYLDNDLNVTRTLKIKGRLLTDNRRTALKYRNALWNLSRVGWVRVLQGGYDWEWYLIKGANISQDFSGTVKHPKYPSHKFMVYNYVKGNAGSDTISINNTTLTAGTDFNSVISNEITATNMAAAITSDIANVTATASGNEVLLSGTVTELSSGDNDSWTAIAGGKQLTYNYAVDVTLTQAPPTSQKDTTEVQ